MENRVNSIEKVLYGNGREGICDRLTRAETKLDEVEEHSKNIAKNAEKLTEKIIEFNAVQKIRARTTNIIFTVVGLAIAAITLYVNHG